MNKNNPVFYYHNMNLTKSNDKRRLLEDSKYKKLFVKSPFTLLSDLRFFTSEKRTSKKRAPPEDIIETIKFNSKFKMRKVIDDDSVLEEANITEFINTETLVDSYYSPINFSSLELQEMLQEDESSCTSITRYDSPSIVPCVDELRIMLKSIFILVNLDVKKFSKFEMCY